MSKTYGYARCSTTEDKQDINRQIRELKPPVRMKSYSSTSTVTPS